METQAMDQETGHDETVSEESQVAKESQDNEKEQEKKSKQTKAKHVKNAIVLKSGKEGYTAFVFDVDEDGEVIPKVCPKNSSVKASTYDEISEKFGWRRSSRYPDGKPRWVPQSWSRDARNEEAKRKRLAKKAAQAAKDEEDQASKEEE